MHVYDHERRGEMYKVDFDAKSSKRSPEETAELVAEFRRLVTELNDLVAIDPTHPEPIAAHIQTMLRRLKAIRRGWADPDPRQSAIWKQVMFFAARPGLSPQPPFEQVLAGVPSGEVGQGVVGQGVSGKGGDFTVASNSWSSVTGEGVIVLQERSAPTVSPFADDTKESVARGGLTIPTSAPERTVSKSQPNALLPTPPAERPAPPVELRGSAARDFAASFGMKLGRGA